MSTNFAKEFKLYESLFSERKQKLTEEANTDLWASPESWTKNNCPNEVYVVLTKDSFGGASDDVFLSWDADDSYYTTVDYLDEVNPYDFHETAAEAEERAKDADSGTLGGWNWAPMHIIKIKNFRDAYFNNKDPEYDVIKTLDFTNKKKVNTSKRKQISNTITKRTGYTAVVGFGAYKQWSIPNAEFTVDGFTSKSQTKIISQISEYLDTLTAEDRKHACVSIFGKDGILVRAYGSAFSHDGTVKVDVSYDDDLTDLVIDAIEGLN